MPPLECAVRGWQGKHARLVSASGPVPALRQVRVVLGREQRGALGGRQQSALVLELLLEHLPLVVKVVADEAVLLHAKGLVAGALARLLGAGQKEHEGLGVAGDHDGEAGHLERAVGEGHLGRLERAPEELEPAARLGRAQLDGARVDAALLGRAHQPGVEVIEADVEALEQRRALGLGYVAHGVKILDDRAPERRRRRAHAVRVALLRMRARAAIRRGRSNAKDVLHDGRPAKRPVEAQAGEARGDRAARCEAGAELRRGRDAQVAKVDKVEFVAVLTKAADDEAGNAAPQP
eukprot:5953533-Pleurochrysis_carterae.AAC.1